MGVFSVDWLRLNARRLSVLALFALAVQFGACFGHNHFHHVFTAGAAAHADPAAPDTGDSHNDNDLCAICTVASLAQTLVGSAPPLLPVPVEIRADISPIAVAAITATPRAGFQSRAPPRS